VKNVQVTVSVCHWCDIAHNTFLLLVVSYYWQVLYVCDTIRICQVFSSYLQTVMTLL